MYSLCLGALVVKLPMPNLLRFACSRCGRCCTRPRVPVNHLDVQRLMRAMHLPAEALVRLYDVTEITFPPGREGWIWFPYGKRILGLKKLNGHCMFLDDNGSCRAYTARPVTCRTYPLRVTYAQRGIPASIAMLKRVQCQHGWGLRQKMGTVVSTARQEDREDAVYYQRLRQWNRKNQLGGKAAFLQYIGCA
jgi:Fe-S-cluster containining protein